MFQIIKASQMKFTCSQIELRNESDYYAVTFWERDQSLEIAPVFESFDAFLAAMGQYVMFQRSKAGDECFVESSKDGYSGDLRKFSLKLSETNCQLAIQQKNVEIDFGKAIFDLKEVAGMLTQIVGDRGEVILI